MKHKDFIMLNNGSIGKDKVSRILQHIKED